jgi:hypothetical protein
LERIQSAASSFVNFRQFLKIIFPSLCTPCSFGGLHVLDPAIQQGVFQLRWLPTLLALSLQPQASTFWMESDIGCFFVFPRLVDFFLYHCLPNHGSTLPDYDYRIKLLFAYLLPKALRHIDSSFRLLFYAMDILPRPFEDIVINSRTVMCLPLPDASLPYNNTPRFKTTAILPASTAHIIDATHGGTQPRLHAEVSSFPRLS